LKWESVCLETEKITLIPSKTRKKKREVKIPIQSDLMAFLRSALIKRGDIYIFPRLAKMRVGSSNGLSATFVKIMAAAKVDRGKPSRVIKEGESKGKGRITYERGFHSLRHTFTSWLRNAGVSEEDRMALTGHSTRESHQIYSHAKEAVLRLAVAKLPLIKDRDQRIVGDTI
jgi:integrase